MSEEEKFSYGFSDESQGMMVIFVPLKKYSEDQDGTAMLRGKLDEIKALCLMRIQEFRMKKNQNGLIKPTNGPANLSVA